MAIIILTVLGILVVLALAIFGGLVIYTAIEAIVDENNDIKDYTKRLSQEEAEALGVKAKAENIKGESLQDIKNTIETLIFEFRLSVKYNLMFQEITMVREVTKNDRSKIDLVCVAYKHYCRHQTIPLWAILETNISHGYLDRNFKDAYNYRCSLVDNYGVSSPST